MLDTPDTDGVRSGRSAVFFRTATLVCCTALAACSSGPQRQSDADPEASTPASELVLKIDPFADFYFLIRAQAAGLVPPNAELASAAQAWQPVKEARGDFGGYWRFDLAGLTSKNPQEFGDWFDTQPAVADDRRGGEVPVQGPGRAMASAMGSAWPWYQETLWPGRRAELEDAVAGLNQRFMPWHEEALTFMMDSLGMVDPVIQVPTFLVIDAHPPGASTYRLDSGPVAVLSVADLLSGGRLSDLEETLLHETCHALDLATRGDSNVFAQLRSLLLEYGVEDRKLLQDVPHLVMFVQSEETMRRLVNPEHVAYGDTWRGDIAPLYQRMEPAAEVVRRHWRSFLDGEQTRRGALESIAREVAATSG